MPDEKYQLAGPAGDIECVMTTPAGWQPGSPIAICCHPHPLHGGTLQNKVVHILAKTFAEMGAKVVRFNFRGVGKSQGSFDHGVGEQQDLQAVADFLRAQSPESPLWLAGFSFGAYVAVMAHTALQPARLVLVAPPVDMFPAIKTQQVVTRDWLLIQGGADEIVRANNVKRWGDGQAITPHLIWLDEAGHFFHGQLTHLQERIRQYWP